MKYHSIAILLLLSGLQLFSQEKLTVMGWNIESGGSHIDVIAARVAGESDVDIWGFSEVEGEKFVQALEAAAEDGEGADYASILGASGSGDRLLIVFDADRLTLLATEELEEINIGGRVRAPLIALFRDTAGGQVFYFMVNHLYRSRSNHRHRQSQMLKEWAERQDHAVIAVGDYNYDWDVIDGESDHDRGFDLLTEDGVFSWIRPAELRRTQCSADEQGNCQYNSVLDFIFAAHLPASWIAESDIIAVPGDFPDDETSSDHRPVRGVFSY